MDLNMHNHGPLDPVEELNALRWSKLHAEVKATPAAVGQIAHKYWAAGNIKQSFDSFESFKRYCTAIAGGRLREAAFERNGVMLRDLQARLQAHGHEQSNDSIDAIAAAEWRAQDTIRGEYSSFESFRAFCRGIARGQVRISSLR